MIRNIRAFNFQGNEYSSHFTTKQKQVIEKMIVNGWESAKSGRTEYIIGQHSATEYRAMIIKNETRTIGRGVQRFADRFVFEWVSISKESQLDHCTNISDFMTEYNEKYPVENCEVIEYDAAGNIMKNNANQLSLF